MATLTATLSGTAPTQTIAITTSDFGVGAGESYSWFQDAPNTAGTFHIGEGGLAQWFHGANSTTASMAPGADTSNKTSGMFTWVDGTNGTADYERPCTGTGSSFGFRVLGAGADVTTWTNTAQVTVHLRGANGATAFETFHTVWANGRHVLAKKNTSGSGYSGSTPGQAFPSICAATSVFSTSGTAGAAPARAFFSGTHCGIVVACFDATPGTMNNSGSGTAGAIAYSNFWPGSGATIPANTVASALLVLSGYDNLLTATVRDNISADYRTHGAGGTTPATNGLLVTTGTGVQAWTDRFGTAVTARTSFYDEQIGAYRIAAATNHVNVGGTAAQWGIDGTTVKARFAPVFVISSWTDTGATPTVSYNGVALTSGIDFIAYNDTANSVLHLALLFDVGASGVRASTTVAAGATVGALDVSAGSSSPPVTSATGTIDTGATLAGSGSSFTPSAPITAGSGTLVASPTLSGGAAGTVQPAIRAAAAAILIASATLGLGSGAGGGTTGNLLGGLGFFPGAGSGAGTIIQPAIRSATGTLGAGATLAGAGTATPPVGPAITAASGTLSAGATLSGAGTGQPAIVLGTGVLVAGATLASTSAAHPAIVPASAALIGGATLASTGVAQPALVPATGTLAVSASLSGATTSQPAIVAASGTLMGAPTLSGTGAVQPAIVAATGTLAASASLSGVGGAQPGILGASSALVASPTLSGVASIGGVLPAAGTLTVGVTLAGTGTSTPAILSAGTRTLEAGATLAGAGTASPPTAPVTSGTGTLSASATLAGAATAQPAILPAGAQSLVASPTLAGNGNIAGQVPITAASGTLSIAVTLSADGTASAPIIAATGALDACATLAGSGAATVQPAIVAGTGTLVASVTLAGAGAVPGGLPQLTAALTWRTLTATIAIGGEGGDVIDVQGGPIDPLDQSVQLVATVSGIPPGTTIAARIDPSGATVQSGFSAPTPAASFVTTAPSVVQQAGATTATVTLAVGDGTQADDAHYEVPLALTAGQTKLVYRLRIAVSDD